MTESKKRKIALETEKLKVFCAQSEIGCFLFNAGSYRLTKGGKVIDYYPKSKKVFRHHEQEWEQIEDIEAFLRFEFQD